MKNLNRREFIKIAGVSGLSLATAKWLGAAEPSVKRPNLLYIFTDQQFGEAMSCAGSPWVKTPNMDRLAASGMRFNLAYTTHPLCSPARASMLTGLMPHQTGVTGNSFSIRPELQQREMGWHFRRAGYRTIYAGKGHLPNYQRLEPSHGFDVLPVQGDRAVTKACAQVLLQKQEKPFLMVVSYIQPHDICNLVSQAEPAAEEGFPGKGKETAAELTAHCPSLPANFDPPTPVPGAAVRMATGGWSAEQWRHYLYAYYRYVEEVDAHIGELLKALRDSGQEDNTLIVFSSDHGDGLGAHHTSGKNLLYEEMARVPFIMNFKGRISPGKVDQEHLVSTGLDLMPTLCDYAGIAAPAGLTGRSLRGLAEGSQPKAWRDQVVIQCGGNGVRGVNVPGRTVRTAQYKYNVYDPSLTPAEPRRHGAAKEEAPAPTSHPSTGQQLEELFDLRKDPGEIHNLAGRPEFQNVLKEHRERLARWCKENGDSWSA